MNLVYNRHAYITARRLAKIIGIMPISEKRASFITVPVIRYGSTMNLPFSGPQVNTRESIQNAANKFYALTHLNVKGITTPKVYTTEDVIEYPVLARLSYHKQGRDIMFCKGPADLCRAMNKGRHYFVEFVEARAEYRVHCIDNEIVKIFRKVKRGSVTNDIIKCARFGWGFYKVDTEQNWLEPMKKKALKSLEVLGLYFGAVDIIHSVDHRFVVLEVNSAPALNAETIIIYADKLRQWLEENYEMERVYRTDGNQRRT